MELDVAGLDLAVFDVHLVSDEHNRNVFANPHDVLVPVVAKEIR